MLTEPGAPRRVPLRLHLAEDDGISLVEILVSIVILGVALAAFAATAIQSLTTITRDEQYVRANQLASDELEGLRALQWDAVGFYANDPGYTATAGDGAQTVTLGSSRPPGAGGLLPTQTITRDGIAYTVDVEIVWLDDPNSPAPPAVDPDPKDYKELRTTLTWSVQGRDFEVHQRSTRRPTTDEVGLDAVPDCVPGEITSFAVSPSTVRLDATGGLDDAISVVVTTCSESTTVTLDPSPRAPMSLTEVPGSDGKEWTTGAFTVGTNGFSLGAHTWGVSAHSSHGTATESTTVEFVEASTQTLAVLSLDITPGLCVKNNDRLHRPTTLRATVTGAQMTDQLVFSWTAEAGSISAGPGTDLGGGQASFVATMPTSAKLEEGNTTITVTLTRRSDGLVVTESYVRTVISNNSGHGCPS